MKVKTFTAISERTLDRKINEFIQGNDMEIIKINFGSTLVFFKRNDYF